MNKVQNTLWVETKNYVKTVYLIKTNFGRVFGGYMPEQWEYTGTGHKVIKNGKTSIFYFSDEQIHIMNQTDNEVRLTCGDTDFIHIHNAFKITKQ